MNDRVLKFHIQIPHEKIVGLFSCTCYAPCWNNIPLKTKFENLVCKISQNVFELASQSLHIWYGFGPVSPTPISPTPVSPIPILTTPVSPTLDYQ